MSVFRHLREKLASALGMGLSVSILVFESESLNCRDTEIVERCQFSPTIFIQNIFEIVGIRIGSINILWTRSSY